MSSTTIAYDAAGGKSDRKPRSKYSRHQVLLGICYMLCMCICGMVLVVLGSTLEDLAELCGTTSTEVGTVFIARGIGAIFGAIVSSKLYECFPGNQVLIGALLSVAVVLVYLPTNTSIVNLHVCFGLLGLGTAITDTGSQIMTTKVHGEVAGPWLGANTVAFGISGAFVPLIIIMTSVLKFEYIIFVCIVLSVATLIAIVDRPAEEFTKEMAIKYKSMGRDASYLIEIVIAVMVFCFIGGKVSATAYLSTYIYETDVVPVSQDSISLFILWLAIAVGRLAGVYDQLFIDNTTLRSHLIMYCIGGGLALVMIYVFPTSNVTFYLGIGFYGLFNGPCVGYCYDLNNRISQHTEMSVSIVMLGLNFGASLVPYVTTVIWTSMGAKGFILVLIASMLIPLPLTLLTFFLHSVEKNRFEIDRDARGYANIDYENVSSRDDEKDIDYDK